MRTFKGLRLAATHYAFQSQNLSYYTNIWLEYAVDEAMKRLLERVQRFARGCKCRQIYP